MRTNVYVDGFNLYYRCLKNTPYKWLDIRRLCQLILPNNSINRIRYFTALVDARPSDPTQPQRQQTYLRALATTPNLSIHYGALLSSTIWAMLVNPRAGEPAFVEVHKTEEKGSDVNIATYLLLDAFDDDYEVAIVVPNDSDLVEPLRVVHHRLGLTVGVLQPQKRPSKELQQAAAFHRPLRQGALAGSQFPDTLTDANGAITKPIG